MCGHTALILTNGLLSKKINKTQRVEWGKRIQSPIYTVLRSPCRCFIILGKFLLWPSLSLQLAGRFPPPSSIKAIILRFPKEKCGSCWRSFMIIIFIIIKERYFWKGVRAACFTCLELFWCKVTDFYATHRGKERKKRADIPASNNLQWFVKKLLIITIIMESRKWKQKKKWRQCISESPTPAASWDCNDDNVESQCILGK